MIQFKIKIEPRLEESLFVKQNFVNNVNNIMNRGRKEEDELIEEDNERVEEIKELQFYSPPVNKKFIKTKQQYNKDKKKRIIKNGLILLLVFFGFAALASNISLEISKKNIQKEHDKVPQELEMTTEFQISLYSSMWKNRRQGLYDFFSFFESISGFPFFKNALIENHRIQFYIHSTKCNDKWDVGFRLRKYIWGPLMGTSTLDCKLETCHYDDCIVAPLIPADKYRKNGYQKLEQDVHPCTKKYSRETRVDNLSPDITFQTCGDLHHYYPHLWGDNVKKNGLTRTGDEYWYSGVYQGYFDNGVKFKSDVTILYNTLDELEKGTILNDVKGEYSLRIWSTHDGFGPWNQTTFNEVSQWHQQLCEHFGSYGNYPCPDN